jgi:hypothetical protein
VLWPSCQPPLVIVLRYDLPAALFDAFLRLVILGALWLSLLLVVYAVVGAQLDLRFSTSEHRQQ